MVKRRRDNDEESRKELNELKFENALMKKQLKEINNEKKVTKRKVRKGVLTCPRCGSNVTNIDTYMVDKPITITTCVSCDFRCTNKRQEDTRVEDDEPSIWKD